MTARMIAMAMINGPTNSARMIGESY
jgi:hypothetical protein